MWEIRGDVRRLGAGVIGWRWTEEHEFHGVELGGNNGVGETSVGAEQNGEEGEEGSWCWLKWKKGMELLRMLLGSEELVVMASMRGGRSRARAARWRSASAIRSGRGDEE